MSVPDSQTVQTNVGPLEYHRGDGGVTEIVLRDGEWERAEAEVIKSVLRKGDTFIDVGAHVGYFSVMAAQIVGEKGRVLAVEASPDNCELLAENLFPYKNAALFAGAAWSHQGFLELYESGVNSGDHRVYPHDEHQRVHRIPAFPLDDWGLKEVSLIKIDTQGTDHKVVEGAVETLKRCRPKIIVEFWPEGIRGFGSTPADVLLFYQNLGYDAELIGSANDALQHRYCSLLLEPSSAA
jgi:FkbM family methyltransferase